MAHTLDWIGWRSLLAGLALFSSASCKEQPAAPSPPPPRPVEVVQVSTEDLPVAFDFVGRTESSQRVEIRSRVDGYLNEIAYTEGDFIEKGDVLFRVDPSPFESRLRAAEAEKAQLVARLENAEALLARIEPLADAEAIAAKELDNARGAVREAAAAVEAAAARVYDAELNLGYTTIVAPVSGLTGEALQREGAYISGQVGMLTSVVQIDPMWVEFSVAETQILRGLRERQAGSVRPPADENFQVVVFLSDGVEHPETGQLTFRDASVSTETGSVLVRAEIPNPEQTLRPGQFVRVELRGAVRPGAIVVPKRAVREGPRGPYLWVVDAESKAEQRPVTLGPWEGDLWVVESGLRADDRVIVNGSMGLRPETPVTITRILAAGSGEGRQRSEGVSDGDDQP